MCSTRFNTWEDWLHEVEDLKERAVDLYNSLPRVGSTNLRQIQQLIKQMEFRMEDKPPVLPEKIVGKNFGENVKKMSKLLENDQVFVIGIHGMGGVGKTFLATYMENEIKRKGTFKHVFWVTVSHDFTIFKLQQRIAEIMGVKLYGDDERSRATILESELEKIEKSVLILDDVWKYIDLEKLGIHLKVNGIKLIITTRLVHVCRQMDCLLDHMIQVKPLMCAEDWELFLLKLGHHGIPAKLPSDIHVIARSVVGKCDGLPLGISVMARTMRSNSRWWGYAKKVDIFQRGEEMKEEVLAVLKRSYDNLIEEDMQKCFLYCALLPSNVDLEDSEDLDDDEIREWNIRVVESGLLNENRSLGKIFDDGRVILDQLIQHSLLLDNGHGLRMHGLVRRMAWHILNQSHSCMVKCHEKLYEIPCVLEWTVDLKVVSLGNSSIKKIPEGLSPNCPRLSTLILSHNQITDIPECFFTHMNALTLLDLSYNDELTTLPNSLTKLRSLTSLVLRRCMLLEHIPPLGELQALSRLDISFCLINELPEGLGNLINLKWLDLCQDLNIMWRTLPGGVLTRLTNMLYLDFHGWSGIKEEDVQGMGMLECFAGSFLDGDNYNRFLREKQDGVCEPKTYLIYFGNFGRWGYDIEEPIHFDLNRRMVCFGDCEELCYLLPTDLVELTVFLNQQWECLCAALSFNNFSSLKKIVIHNCTKLKSLFCLSCSLCTNIQMLESLDLKDLRSLTVILKKDVAFSHSWCFTRLKHFTIKECHQIEKLLTAVLVRQLRNLESISVEECNSVEEIFAVSNSGGGDDSFNVYLPKLTWLYLSRLPLLKTVCGGILECGSENILTYEYCPKLAMLPRIRRAG